MQNNTHTAEIFKGWKWCMKSFILLSECQTSSERNNLSRYWFLIFLIQHVYVLTSRYRDRGREGMKERERREERLFYFLVYSPNAQTARVRAAWGKSQDTPHVVSGACLSEVSLLPRVHTGRKVKWEAGLTQGQGQGYETQMSQLASPPHQHLCLSH